MAEIEVVIKINEDTFNHIRNGGNIGASLLIENAIKNGTKLPKGHGDLIDREALEEEISCGDPDAYILEPIREAYTVLEADESEEEEQSWEK